MRTVLLSLVIGFIALAPAFLTGILSFSYTAEINFILFIFSIYIAGIALYAVSRLLFRPYVNDFFNWFAGYFVQRSKTPIGMNIIEDIYNVFLASDAKTRYNIMERRETAVTSIAFTVSIFVSLVLYVFLWYGVPSIAFFLILMIYIIVFLIAMFNSYNVKDAVGREERMFAMSYTTTLEEKMKTAASNYMNYAWR